ncbi:ThuA domain-containing protein [Streptomyces sp. NRRL B-2790]|uniref:ThuA domain-containing protein n=1 Tax=Streptomyces sp. NRRL B-2790 TaxID=1463835 RepID=UPI003568DAC6
MVQQRRNGLHSGGGYSARRRLDHRTPRLVRYTRTTDYRHDSVPDAADAVRALGEFTVGHTEDPADLEHPQDGYAAVVLPSTSGDVLTPVGRECLAGHVGSGGGFAGVRAAARTECGRP